MIVEENGIRALHAEILDAWNARDADRYAAAFTKDANVIGFDGSMMDGSEEIAAELARIFADHETASYIAKVLQVRSLADGVAVLRAVVGMVPPGQQDINPAVNAVQSLVAVRENGGWRATLLQNTPAAFHGRPQDSDRLTEELRRVLRGS